MKYKIGNIVKFKYNTRYEIGVIQEIRTTSDDTEKENTFYIVTNDHGTNKLSDDEILSKIVEEK